MPIELPEEPELMGTGVKAAGYRGILPCLLSSCCSYKWLWDLASSAIRFLPLEGSECHLQLLLEWIIDNSSNLEIFLLLCFLPLEPTRPPNYERVDWNSKGSEVQTCQFCLKLLQFCSVQSLSHVWLFATPWIAACQASLSITNARSSPKLMSIESVMPSNHLILCCPLLLLPSIFPSIRVFSNESAHQVAKVLEFQLQHQFFQWTPRTYLL